MESAKKIESNLAEIAEIAKIFSELSGNHVEPKHYTMIESRITRRLHELGIKTVAEYIPYLKTNYAKESGMLISLLTTHHTFFFREFKHFEYLEKGGLREIINGLKASGKKKLKVWSAAASYGHEIYSLAMFIDNWISKNEPGFDFEILGTDISDEALTVAKNGVYRWDEVKEIPHFYLEKYWAKGTGDISEFVKFKKEVKAKCKFIKLNLLELTKGAPPTEKYDIIFCRNVFIYFTQDKIKEITNGMIGYMHDQGLLILGLSETISGLGLPLKSIGSSMFNRTGVAPAKVLPIRSVDSKMNSSINLPNGKREIFEEKLIRVLCVDDSSTVLILLKKILTKENGFEIAGTAKNGIEAAEFLKNNKVDAMTLDIHMPEMNGVEYLQKHFQAGHPPVIMISSVAREDTDLAIRSMQFGATDYIEKPSLEGFDDKKDEICSKIRFAVNTPDARGLSEKALEIDHKFSKDFALKDLDKKVRVIIASPRENKKLEFLFKQLKGGQPPIVIVSYGPINLMEKTLSSLRSDLVLGLPGAGSMKVGGLYLTEFNKDFEGIRSTSSKMKACYMILGAPSVRDSKKIIGVPGAHFIFEDLKKVHKDHDNILNMASEVVPVTSFIYHADRYFLEGK